MINKLQFIWKVLKSKFARSIMIPLVSIFVAVLAAIVFIVFSSFSNQLKDDRMEKRLQQLSATERNISARIIEVNYISNYISNDSLFSFVKLDYNPSYSGYEMSKKLKELLVGNEFVSYLTYYRISEEDKVYTSVGEMLFHNFWKGYIDFTDEKEQDYIKMIQSLNNRTILPLNKTVKGKGYLSLVYPLPLYQKIPQAYIIAYVDGQKIDDITGALFSDCQGIMMICDLQNQPIYQYTAADFPDMSDEIREKIINSEDDYQRMNVNHEEYLIFRHRSDYNGWKYVSVIRRSDITSELTSQQVDFILLLLYIILSAIIATMVCVLFNYREINRLAHTVTMDLKISDKKAMNEQLLLSNAYVYLREKTQRVTQNLFIENLIEGQYDETSIDFAVNEANLHFEYPGFCTCEVYFHETPDQENREIVMGDIKDYFELYDMQCYPLFQLNPNRILLLLNADAEVLLWNNFSQILCDFYHKFTKEGKETVNIGVGNVYSSLLEMNRSANEALSAMYFCILEGEQRIIHYNDIDMEYLTTMFSNINSKLVSKVKQGDIEGIHQVIGEANSIFLVNDYPIQHQNFVAYNILTSIIEYADDSLILEYINDLLGRILDPSHRYHLLIFSEIEKVCVAIANHKNEMRNSNRNSELIDTIKKAISDNLCDSMMSLDSIAEICGISPSYMSRCFKAQLGCTPMHYVDTLRMNLVKEKLCNTNESLKQILTDTGYIDQSNFIRKFRKIEGITPMAYRKRHKNQD